MRKPSIYMKSTFLEQFNTVSFNKERTKEEIFSACIYICDFTKKDFLDIEYGDAQGYLFHLLERYNKGEIKQRTVLLRINLLTILENKLHENKSDNYDYFFKRLYYSINKKRDFDLSVSIATLPNLVALDNILKVCEKTQFHLAFLLVMHCALTSTEIIAIKKSDIIPTKTEVYLSIQRERERISLPLPADSLAIELRKAVSTIKDNDYLFVNTKGQPYSIRAFNYNINNIVTSAGYSYSIRNIRAFAISQLMNQNDPKYVAWYTSLQDVTIRNYQRGADYLENNMEIKQRILSLPKIDKLNISMLILSKAASLFETYFSVSSKPSVVFYTLKDGYCCIIYDSTIGGVLAYSLNDCHLLKPFNSSILQNITLNMKCKDTAVLFDPYITN